MRSRSRWLVLSLSTCVPGAVGLVVGSPQALEATTASERPASVPDVIVESGRLSVHVRDARLGDVLRAVGRQSGVEIVLRGDPDTPVTESFTALPLDKGIRQLARWHSVVLLYGPSSDTPAGQELIEVWVMGSALAKAAPSGREARTMPPVSMGPNTRPADRQNSQPLPVAAPRGQVRTAPGSTFSRGSEATPSVVAAPAGESAADRIQGLQALLMEQGVEAVQALRDAATSDPALEVRLMAVRALASMNTEKARDALADALTDRDQRVRNVATRAFARWQAIP